MKSATKVFAIAVATVSLGAAGYHLLTLEQIEKVAPKPIPLNVDLGPIGLLQEPAASPYDMLMEKAVRQAPMADSQERERVLGKLRELRDRWKDQSRVAAIPGAERKPNSPDRL